MRDSFVSLPLIFSLLALACTAAPAEASEQETKFLAWAAGKSGELDNRWEQTTLRHARAAGAEFVPPSRALGRSADWAPARSAPATTAVGGRAFSGSDFTRRADGQFLNLSTRSRGGPARGVDKLTSPAAATRSFAGERRLPFNNLSKYTKSVHTGRSSALRPSPQMGTRISNSAVYSRSPSGLRGATRERRSPSRGR